MLENIEIEDFHKIPGRGLIAVWSNPPSGMKPSSLGLIKGEIFSHKDRAYRINGCEYIKSGLEDSIRGNIGLLVTELSSEDLVEEIKTMTPKEYMKGVLLTESVDFDAIRLRLSTKRTIRLLHGAEGLCTESGEFMDMLKKHIFYGKDLDLVNAGEEIGDIFWYIGIILDELGLSFEEVMKKNNAKLMARYNKKKFDANDAQNRDLKKERVILEGK